MSGIVCPNCNAYLGLNSANAKWCPNCRTRLITSRPDQAQDDNDNDNRRHDRYHKVGTGCLMLLSAFAMSLAVSAGFISGGGVGLTIGGLFLFGAARVVDGLLGLSSIGKVRKKKRPKNPTATDRCVKRAVLFCMALGSLGFTIYGLWNGAEPALIFFEALLGLLGGVFMGLILGLACALGSWLFIKPSASEPILDLIVEGTDGTRFTQR